MKKIYSNGDVRSVTCIAVHIKFSKEIAYWDKDGYYQNPKFAEFWDKVNTNPKYHHVRYNPDKRDNIWHVYYCNKHCQDLAEQGKLGSNVVRFLTVFNNNYNIFISPEMSTIFIHEPSEFPTTHGAGLLDLATLCADCARYCGGTVDITYSAVQRRFLWEDVPQKTVTLGKGIRKWRIRDVVRTRTAPEVNHTWESDPHKQS